LIVDTLKEAIRKKLEAYKTDCARFFFAKLDGITVCSETLREAASHLVACYPDDLVAALAEELVDLQPSSSSFGQAKS